MTTKKDGLLPVCYVLYATHRVTPVLTGNWLVNSVDREGEHMQELV